MNSIEPSSMPYLIAVELHGESEVVLYSRPPGDDGGMGTLVRRVLPFEPFLLLKDDSWLSVPPSRLEWLEGEGEFRLKASYHSWSDLRLSLKLMKERIRELPLPRELPFLRILNPVSQYLVGSAQCQFQGLAFDQVVRLQLDVEAHCSADFQFPNALREEDRILVISLTDSTGWECTLSAADMDERSLLEAFVATVRGRDPDIIEGHNLFKFDLPYLEGRAAHHHVPLELGREGQLMRSVPGKFATPSRSVEFQNYLIYGRHVVDTMHIAMALDGPFRRFERFGLKDIARSLGLSQASRTYVDGARVGEVFKVDPERVTRYCLDDARETRAVAAALTRDAFAITQAVPAPYQEVVRGDYADCLELVLLKALLHERRAIPRPPPVAPPSSEVSVPELRKTGLVKNILHLDLRGMRSAILSCSQSLTKSPSRLRLQSVLSSLKLEHPSSQASQGAHPDPEAHRRSPQEGGLEPLLQAVGDYGGERRPFADRALHHAVSKEASLLLQEALKRIEAVGAAVIEVNHKSLYISVSDADFAEPSSLLEAVKGAEPALEDMRIDGQYLAMVSQRPANHALRSLSGQLLLRGSDIRSGMVEPFQRRFVQELLERVLDGQAASVGQLYADYKGAIEQHHLPPEDFCRRELLFMSLEEYQQKVSSSRRDRSVVYELAIASGRAFRVNDPVVWYMTGNGVHVPALEHARLIDCWRPEVRDENVPYYIHRLEAIYKQYESLVVSLGGPSMVDLRRLAKRDPVF